MTFKLRFLHVPKETDDAALIKAADRVIRGLCLVSIGKIGDSLRHTPSVVELKFRSMAAAQKAMFEITTVFEQTSTLPCLDIYADWPDLQVNNTHWSIEIVVEEPRRPNS